MTSDGAAAQVVMSQTSQSLKSKFTRLALVVCLTLCLSLPQLAISQESELRDAWRQFPLSQSLAAQYFDAIDGDLNEAARTLRPRQNWEEAIMWSALLDLAGQDEEAIQELERVVEQVPDQAVAWEALARRLMREASRVAQASEAWTTCLSLTQNPDPQASTRLREASLWFERSGQVAEASQALERLIVINSDDIESRLRLVQLYQQQQQAQRAVIHLQSIATGGSANQRLEAVTSLAELATQAGDAPQAFEHWQTALHLLPWNHWRISSVLQAVMKTAPEPETIIAHWEAQHEKEPHDPKWLVFLAGAYRVQENLGEELRILERLRDVHEAGLQYGLRLVEVLELLDKPSLATWKSLVDQYPDHWEAARGYADVLANQDQLEKALEFWEAYEERLAWRPMIEDWKLSYGAFTRLHEEQRIRVLENPQDSLERQAAVQAALDVGDTEEALGLIEQVAGRLSGSEIVEWLVEAAAILESRGLLAQAMKTYGEAAGLEDASYAVFLRLAKVERELGMLAPAKASLQQARTLARQTGDFSSMLSVERELFALSGLMAQQGARNDTEHDLHPWLDVLLRPNRPATLPGGREENASDSAREMLLEVVETAQVNKQGVDWLLAAHWAEWSGDIHQSLEYAVKAMEADPKLRDASLYWRELTLSHGRLSECLEALQWWGERFPEERRDAQRRAIRVCIEKNDPGQALLLLERWRADLDKDIEVVDDRILALQADGRWEESLRQLQAHHQQGDLASLEQRAEQWILAWEQTGRVQEGLRWFAQQWAEGSLELRLRIFQRVIRFAGRHGGLPLLDEDLRRDRGVADPFYPLARLRLLNRMGRNRDAQELLRTVLSERRLTQEELQPVLQVALAQGDYVAAVQTQFALVHSQPRPTIGELLRLSQLQELASDYQGAQSTFQELLRRSDLQVEDYLAGMDFHFRSGQPELGQEWLERAEQRFRQHPDVLWAKAIRTNTVGAWLAFVERSAGEQALEYIIPHWGYGDTSWLASLPGRFQERAGLGLASVGDFPTALRAWARAPGSLVQPRRVVALRNISALGLKTAEESARLEDLMKTLHGPELVEALLALGRGGEALDWVMSESRSANSDPRLALRVIEISLNTGELGRLRNWNDPPPWAEDQGFWLLVLGQATLQGKDAVEMVLQNMPEHLTEDWLTITTLVEGGFIRLAAERAAKLDLLSLDWPQREQAFLWSLQTRLWDNADRFLRPDGLARMTNLSDARWQSWLMRQRFRRAQSFLKAEELDWSVSDPVDFALEEDVRAQVFRHFLSRSGAVGGADLTRQRAARPSGRRTAVEGTIKVKELSIHDAEVLIRLGLGDLVAEWWAGIAEDLPDEERALMAAWRIAKLDLSEVEELAWSSRADWSDPKVAANLRRWGLFRRVIALQRGLRVYDQLPVGERLPSLMEAGLLAEAESLFLETLSSGDAEQDFSLLREHGEDLVEHLITAHLWDDALLVLDRLAAKFPDDQGLKERWVKLAYRADRIEKAVATVQDLVLQNPQWRNMRELLVEGLTRKGALAEAEKEMMLLDRVSDASGRELIQAELFLRQGLASEVWAALPSLVRQGRIDVVEELSQRLVQDGQSRDALCVLRHALLLTEDQESETRLEALRLNSLWELGFGEALVLAQFRQLKGLTGLGGVAKTLIDAGMSPEALVGVLQELEAFDGIEVLLLDLLKKDQSELALALLEQWLTSESARSNADAWSQTMWTLAEADFLIPASRIAERLDEQGYPAGLLFDYVYAPEPQRERETIAALACFEDLRFEALRRGLEAGQLERAVRLGNLCQELEQWPASVSALQVETGWKLASRATSEPQPIEDVEVMLKQLAERDSSPQTLRLVASYYLVEDTMPNLPQAWRKFGLSRHALPQLFFEAGVLLLEEGNMSSAMGFLGRHPELLVPVKRVEPLLELGGDAENWTRLLSESIALTGSVEARRFLGQRHVRWAQENPAEAGYLLAEASGYAPDWWEPVLLRAELLKERNGLTEARELVRDFQARTQDQSARQLAQKWMEDHP